MILSLFMNTIGANTSFYDYIVTNIQGDEVSMDEYKGKVIMIVNTASECGYTSQYDDLQKLYTHYRKKGLVILGFPSNNFGNQEPGSNEEIMKFCEVNFNISFPLFSKVDVIGPRQDPLFTYLSSVKNQDFTGDILWNFEKFLLDREGKLQRIFRSAENPNNTTIKNAIQELL